MTPTCAKYKKRPGTSGIRGHLYEINLLSLINFRAKNDPRVENYFLATNVDNIGTFDDICFRAEVKGYDRPVAVFIQAKHSENDKVLTLNSKLEFTKCFDSYMKIRRAFKPGNKDILFEGNFNETECRFVIYTNAKTDPTVTLAESNFAVYLNELISTGKTSSLRQPIFNDKDVEYLCEIILKEQIATLAERIAKFLRGEGDFQMIMNDEYVAAYHVILAQRVIDVFEVQPEGYRNARFREDFYDINDEFLLFFRDNLCKEMLKNRKYKKVESDALVAALFKSPLDITVVSKLIECVITYENGKFQFVKKVSDDLKQQLTEVNVTQAIVDEAAAMALRELLKPFKVPVTFGNKDIFVNGEDSDVEKRLDKITNEIDKIKQNKIVILDDTLGDLVQLRGGICGTVGNLLVFDKNSNLMKITDHTESLEKNSKRLLAKLQNKINNLQEYRFKVNAKKCPKLSFDISEHDRNMVRDFISKLLLYRNQADVNGVEEILKNEIKLHLRNDENIFKASIDTIFLRYYNEIKKWWMIPKEAAYLTENSNILASAIKNIVQEPLMTAINSVNTMKMKYIDYKFDKIAIKTLMFHDQTPGTIITTESVLLTLCKVKQLIKNKDYVILDLEYILYLGEDDYSMLQHELRNTNKDKIIIIVCNNLHNTRDRDKKLKNIAEAVNDKHTIIITNEMIVDVIKNVFLHINNIVKDERTSLLDMSDELRQSILRGASINFFGAQVNLGPLVDESNIVIFRGNAINKMLLNEKIEIPDLTFVVNENDRAVVPHWLINIDENRTYWFGLDTILQVHTNKNRVIRVQPTMNIIFSLNEYKDSHDYIEKLHDIDDVRNTVTEVSSHAACGVANYNNNGHYFAHFDLTRIVSYVSPSTITERDNASYFSTHYNFSFNFKFILNFNFNYDLSRDKGEWTGIFMNGYRKFKTHAWRVGISCYISLKKPVWLYQGHPAWKIKRCWPFGSHCCAGIRSRFLTRQSPENRPQPTE